MKREIQKLTLGQRLSAETPKFFKTFRTVGLCLAAAGGAVLSASVTLPAAIVTVAGAVMTAVSQAAVEGE